MGEVSIVSDNLFASPVIPLSLANGSFQVLKDPSGAAKMQFIEPAFRGRDGLVVFQMPWCPHCQNLAPTMTKLATITQGLFPVGVINCDDTANGNNLLSDYFNITGYPTIKYYNNGTFTDYTGGQTLQDFLRFLCKNRGICDLELPDVLQKFGLGMRKKMVA